MVPSVSTATTTTLCPRSSGSLATAPPSGLGEVALKLNPVELFESATQCGSPSSHSSPWLLPASQTKIVGFLTPFCATTCRGGPNLETVRSASAV